MTPAQELYDALAAISVRPAPFSLQTTRELWTDDYISAQMLTCHLDPTTDLASRRHAFIDRSVAWLAERCGVGPGTRVLDLGCGPGLYTTRLARLGADVTGVDFSSRSLAYARETAVAAGLAIEYVAADYLAYQPATQFALVTLIFCDFCVLSPAQRALLLDRIHGLLAPAGRLVLDAPSLAGYARRQEASTWSHCPPGGFWSADECFELRQTRKYDAEQVVLDHYTVVERARTRVIANWLQYYAPETLCAELGRRGLAVEEVYGDVAGAPFTAAAPELAVVARRAG